MTERNFKIIKGGADEIPTDAHMKFISAFVTDTRLMGVVGLYIHWEDAPVSDALSLFEQEQIASYDEFYEYCDETLFRDDIDINHAIDMIVFVMEGLFEGQSSYANDKEFIKKLKDYLDLFRTAFYKQP